MDVRNDVAGGLVFEEDVSLSFGEAEQLRQQDRARRILEQNAEWREHQRRGRLDKPGTFEAEHPPPPWLRKRVHPSRPIVRWVGVDRRPLRAAPRRREARVSRSSRTSRASPSRSSSRPRSRRSAA